MPDPVSERAEYVVLARRGRAKLFLLQRGQWQDAGPVAVIFARPLGAVQAVARWLSRIWRLVGDRLPARDAPALPARRSSGRELTQSSDRRHERGTHGRRHRT